MTTKRELQDWNKRKWEHKNHAMYEKYAQNKWPWFIDKLDPDVDEYLRANGLSGLDILDLGTCSGSQGIELARRGHRVVGTDVSETALERAKLAAASEPKLAISFLLDFQPRGVRGERTARAPARRRISTEDDEQ